MAERLPTDVSFFSDEERYVAYSLQPKTWLERLTCSLCDSEAADCRIIVLSGMPGTGRTYFLEAAAYAATQLGHKTKVVPLDLDGFEDTGRQVLPRYVNHQLATRYRTAADKLKPLLGKVSVDLQSMPQNGWVAAFLSIGLSAAVPVKTLIDLLGRSVRSVPGPAFPERHALAQLLKLLTDKTKVILHVVDSPRLTLTQRRWLAEEAEHNARLFLALSCPPGASAARVALRGDAPCFEFEFFNRQSLRERLDARFTPNRFPAWFYDALLRYSIFPGEVVAILHLLVKKGFLDWTDDQGWHVSREAGARENLAKELAAVLYEPIGQLRECVEPNTYQLVEAFLRLAALCGQNVPASYIFQYMNMSDAEGDALTDVLDTYFVGEGPPSFFQDLAYQHPSFPNSMVYRWLNPLLRFVVLDKATGAVVQRIASELMGFLKRKLAIRSRGVARMFLELAHFMKREEEQELHEHELAWWVGQEDAQHLKDTLVAMLKDGTLRPETLWEMVLGTKNHWPPYRRLALLDAYEQQPYGIATPNFPSFLNVKGCIFRSIGRYDKAEAFLRQALNLNRQLHGYEHRNVAVILSNLAVVLCHNGDCAAGEALCREALAMDRKLLSDDDPDTSTSINNMGYLLQRQGKLAEAEEYYCKALETRRRVLGDDDPDTLSSIGNMGTVLAEQGKLGDAEPYFCEALERRRRVLGDDHWDTLASMYNMGGLLEAQGKLPKAEPYYREALKGRRRVLGDDHPDTLTSIHNMGFLLHAQGKLGDAEPYFCEALERSRRVLGDDHPRTLAAIHNMGALLRGLGQYAEAEELGAEAVRRARSALPAGHWHTAAFLFDHGRTLAAMARFAEAEAQMLEAHERLVAAFGGGHEGTVAVVKALIDLYDAWHAAEPDAGHDAQAAEWRAKLEAWQATAHPAATQPGTATAPTTQPEPAGVQQP